MTRQNRLAMDRLRQGELRNARERAASAAQGTQWKRPYSRLPAPNKNTIMNHPSRNIVLACHRDRGKITGKTGLTPRVIRDIAGMNEEQVSAMLGRVRVPEIDPRDPRTTVEHISALRRLGDIARTWVDSRAEVKAAIEQARADTEVQAADIADIETRYAVMVEDEEDKSKLRGIEDDRDREIRLVRARNRHTTAVVGEARRECMKNLMDARGVPHCAPIPFDISEGTSDADAKQMRADMETVYELFPDTWKDGIPARVKVYLEHVDQAEDDVHGKCAWSDDGATVTVRYSTGDVGALIHELGHMFERKDGNSHIWTCTRNYLYGQRVSDSEPNTVYEEKPAFKDNLVHAACGIRYVNNETEMFSTGLEMLYHGGIFGAGIDGLGVRSFDDEYTDPIKGSLPNIMKSDVDHVNFITGTILNS